ncbi:MAG TPA: DUF4328 domain-containing protein [Prosthecobacter sp.]|nr:DUF4328 domain-containing protein [Prosthecobacter sp.]
MSKIFIANDGESKEYEEYQVNALWKQGVLNADALYWREGMADWRPLTEYFAKANIASAQAAPPVVRYSYTKNPRTLTQVLVVLLGLFLGMKFVSIAGDMSQLSLLSGVFSENAAGANDSRQQMIGLAYLAVFLTTAVVFAMWTYRANVNARGFGAGWMEISPGWAVGSYFIPFLNLVRPYQAMKEIWNASTNPHESSKATNAAVGVWWGLWLLSGFLGQISLRLSMDADTVEKLKSATVASMASSIVGIPLTLMAIIVVKSIARKQERLVTGR